MIMMMNTCTDVGRGPCGAPTSYIKRKTLGGIKSLLVVPSKSFSIGPCFHLYLKTMPETVKSRGSGRVRAIKRIRRSLSASPIWWFIIDYLQSLVTSKKQGGAPAQPSTDAMRTCFAV
jgi:hypothetical protein